MAISTAVPLCYKIVKYCTAASTAGAEHAINLLTYASTAGAEHAINLLT